jgi:hypothetical protein
VLVCATAADPNSASAAAIDNVRIEASFEEMLDIGDNERQKFPVPQFDREIFHTGVIGARRLIRAAEDREFLMHVRIGVMQALNRHVERKEFLGLPSNFRFSEFSLDANPKSAL